MALLEQFFIKYLTNAKEAAKDTRDLDKANQQLTEDIKKQTAEEKKRNEEVHKTARAMQDLVANITSAAAAYIGLNAVRNGIVKAADFNNTLALESKLLGQNAQQISAFGAAMEQFGGSAADFQGWLHGLTMEYAAMGREIPKVETMLRSVNREIAGRNRTEQLFILNRYGINNAAQQRMLMQSPEEFDRMVEKMKEVRPANEAAARASREWSQATALLGNALGSVFDKLAENLLPAMTWVVEKITDFISNNRGLIASLTAVGTSLVTVIGLMATGGLIKALTGAIPLLTAMAGGFLGIAKAVAAIGVAAMANPIVLAILGIAAAAGIGYMGYQALTSGTSGGSGGSLIGSGIGIGASVGGLKPNEAGMKAFQFWKSQGYSDAQAAGWVANMMAESGGNAGARGDRGKAHGLFQWHPDRRAGILRGTGIDVSNASFEEQLRAAAWEAEQRGDAHLVRQARSEEDAAAIISKKFERPANGDYEAMKRGRMADDFLRNAQSQLNVAGGNQFGAAGASSYYNRSNTNTVNVGGLTVNSNAADPQAVAAAAADAVGQHVSLVISNADDGAF
jgi:hypothetical protein